MFADLLWGASRWALVCQSGRSQLIKPHTKILLQEFVVIKPRVKNPRRNYDIFFNSSSVPIRKALKIQDTVNY